MRRLFTRSQALRCFAPPAKANDTGGLFAIMAIIGACSVTILPVGLELAMEITHNAGSSAILWFACVTDPVVLRASSC